MTTIRDYQADCRDAVLSAWGEKPWHKGGETFRSVLANLSTSAGKTVIVGDIIRTIKDRGRCLFLADTDELCTQPRQKFFRLFQMHAAVEKASDHASLLADLVVGSAQTLMRQERLERFGADHFRYIFVDEAHRGSDRNKKITDYFAAAKVMGMTATAFRAKLADLSDYYDTVAFEMGMFDLIDEGYLVRLNILTLPVVVDIRKIKQTMTTEGMEYDKTELDTTITPYYEEICRLILEHAKDRQIIAYLPLIKSSQAFVKIAREQFEIDARHVDGKSPDREELVQAFEKRQFQLLSNSMLLTTGWDCPAVDCLLNLAPTRSIGLFRQKVGRIGRVLPGVIDGITDKDQRKAAIAESAKPDSLILDLLWQTERFGVAGPSDLIAANLEEKQALELRLSRLKGANDLQEVSARVQEEREAALKQALQEAAERKKAFGGAAIDLVGATLHSKKLVDYEPSMKWEKLPITDGQRAWMIKNGFDPESAKNRGHASAFLGLIFMRKKLGLAPYRAVAALEKSGISGAIRFTAQRAYEILQGNYPMSFGKHAMRGTPLRAIPESYWDWCMEQDWFRDKFPIEYQFVRGVVQTNGGCTCIGDYIAPNCPVHPRQPPAESGADYFDCLEPENKS
jgi:superfamily II DNA or RNA helicase